LLIHRIEVRILTSQKDLYFGTEAIARCGLRLFAHAGNVLEYYTIYNCVHLLFLSWWRLKLPCRDSWNLSLKNLVMYMGILPETTSSVQLSSGRQS
jgi:hypothetical protein